MSALSILYLVLPFPLAFVIHDAEEALMQHRWIARHRAELKMRFAHLAPIVCHLEQLTTRAFIVAAFEELVLIIGATAYLLVDGPFSTDVWIAMMIAFALHQMVHLVQALLVKGYVPGIVTTVLLLPYSIYALHSISLVRSIGEMLVLGVLGVLFMVVNLRFAHWLGIYFAKKTQK